MKYTNIPHTDIKVSKICLGTMTYGEQNSEVQAHEQLDYAVTHGINFIDTAELYAVPSSSETQGLTEQYIGTWLRKTGLRKELVLATKIAGPSGNLKHIRENLGFSKKALDNALAGSLKRLQTDFIDLYQLHWPDRNANFFGKRGYVHNSDEQWSDNVLEVIEHLDNWVREGKIRHYGLSNETPWGIMKHLKESENHNLTRVKTVQNPYSLVNRTFEIGNAEVSMREKVGLLAYSPMAFGKLSGKYIERAPKKSRIALFPQMSRYSNSQVDKAIELYAEIAKKYGLSLAQMSLAFVNHQVFLTSNIIGATTMEQLKENIDSINIDLSGEVLQEIEAVHNVIPNPAP
jgi:aryl-alcohol dehydrogenase-like predicted oxidoreductase